MAQTAPRRKTAEQAISFTLPAQLLKLLGWTPEEAPERVKERFLIELFREAEISGGKVAEILGMHGKSDFMDLLAKYRVPYLDLSEEELRQELEVVRARRRRLGNSSSPIPGR